MKIQAARLADMRRQIMQTIARIGAVALLFATAVPAFAAPDPETDQLFCDLAGQCGGSDAASDSSPPAATSASPRAGAPRTGATRGFTFKRQAPAGGTAPAADQSQQTAAGAAAAARPKPPSRVGVSNLRLSFASGSATLTEGDKARLAKLAQVLGSPALTSRRTRIEGHTDASGSATGNRELSRRRAQSVADYLVSSGIASSRLEVVGFGSSQPLAGVPALSPENRRVMAVVLN
jgi:outer membrane protein OmpA-like peptidoglycan-associated protein